MIVHKFLSIHLLAIVVIVAAAAIAIVAPAEVSGDLQRRRDPRRRGGSESADCSAVPWCRTIIEFIKYVVFLCLRFDDSAVLRGA